MKVKIIISYNNGWKLIKNKGAVKTTRHGDYFRIRGKLELG
jgi:hypothetical protein